jgi:hypothetical protein
VAVLAIALYLIVVAYMLNDVSFTVGTVLVGVRSIAHATQPIGPVVRGIEQDIRAVADNLEGIIVAAEDAEAEREALERAAR